MFFIFNAITSLLGITIGPLFFTLQLLLFVTMFETTRYIVRSITLHWQQLTLAFTLMIFVIYAYSVLTISYFYKDIEINAKMEQDYQYCNYMWECVLFTIDHGLRNGGGIADSTVDIDPARSSKYVSKFFYDVGFFVLINIIALNIIQAIIIDTFADMRDRDDERGKLHR